MLYGSLPAEFNIDVVLIEILLVTNYIIFESNQIRLVGFSNGLIIYINFLWISCTRYISKLSTELNYVSSENLINCPKMLLFKIIY